MLSQSNSITLLQVAAHPNFNKKGIKMKNNETLTISRNKGLLYKNIAKFMPVYSAYSFSNFAN